MSTRIRSFLGVAEVAARLGVSRAHLYDEIRAGRFPFVRVGAKRVAIDEDELHAFLSLRGVSGAEAAQRFREGGARRSA